MKFGIRVILLWLVCALLILTGTIIANAQLIPDGLSVERIRVDGRMRRYLLSVPDRTAPETGFPIVFVLHGGGGAAPQVARQLMIHQHQTGEKFIVVYPESTAIKLKRNWNDGRTASQPGRESLAEVDDVKFIHTVLSKIESDQSTDKRRVFASGISNGAFMVHRLAAESDRFAAIGPVIGSMAKPVAKNFQPTKHISVIAINSVNDPMVPYAGGNVRFGKTNLGESLGVEEAMRHWATHNHCQQKPVNTVLPDTDPSDGTRVTRISYRDGRQGTEVQLLKIDGGGHNWPNTRQYAPESLIGKTCRDIDATEELLQFFLKHPQQ